MKNIFSIDIESWVHFYIDALKIKPDAITGGARRELDNHYIADATGKILDLLDEYRQKATFFVVAEIYGWQPDIIREIAKRGHEIGYHTHSHLVLQNKEILARELEKSKDFIAAFQPVGFRAPQIYLQEDAFAVLKQYGFKYSSSTYDSYQVTDINGVAEIPVAAFSFRQRNNLNQKLPKQLTAKLLLNKIPFGSGLFISLFGSKTAWFIDKINKHNQPAVLFVHPWQLYKTKEINSIRFKLKMLSRNPACLPYSATILNPIKKLFKKYQFTSFKDYYGY